MDALSKGHRNKILAALSLVFLVLLADQMLKFWVKTNMSLAQEIAVAGKWFILHFTENDGMAFGLKFGGTAGKLILTSFRIIAVIAIGYYLYTQIRKGISMTLTLLIACILAGAIGNIIDSVFYGRFFTESTFLTKASLVPSGEGYSNWFRGKVVDMFYFPIIESNYPKWVPILGGREFIFFRPVFNLADASISVGVFAILLFYRNAFTHTDETSQVKAEVEPGDTENREKLDANKQPGEPDDLSASEAAKESAEDNSAGS